MSGATGDPNIRSAIWQIALRAPGATDSGAPDVTSPIAPNALPVLRNVDSSPRTGHLLLSNPLSAE